MDIQNTLEFAKQQDESDPLKHFRNKFFIPKHNGKESIYFIGNSLGLQPKSVSDYIKQELDDWANLGVEGHFRGKHPWVSYHEIFPKQLSKIVGSTEKEVVVMNQLTVNLHLLMVSFYRPDKKRYKIICEEKAFPSDQYALESQVKFHGLDPGKTIVEVKRREGERKLMMEDIISTIQEHGDSVALVLFGGVNYYTGQFFNLQMIIEAAHAVGAYAGFDLAHAAGNVELKLHDWNADFACWCSYKYLNSGPGGVGGIYVHEKYATDSSCSRFAGWWGHTKETRFKMEKGFEAIPTAEGWQISNAPILSMAAHKASLDIFDEAGMEKLHQKRKKLSGFLHTILNEINRQNKNSVIEVITPAEENENGCQVSMLIKEKGKEVFDSLTKNGVMADWREPNVIRIAPVPLYNRFEEVWQFGNIVQEIICK